MRRRTLTLQQQTVLDFVVAFTDQHGYPPTLREIGTAIGLANVNAVRGHLAALEKKGRITRAPDKARSIQLVPAPSRLSRIKRGLHRILGTDAGVGHDIVYGLAWRWTAPGGDERAALRRAFEQEAAEHGWTLLRCDIAADRVIVAVRVWPNHSAQRTVRRLQSAAHAAAPLSPALGKSYVATTDLAQLDELVNRLIPPARREHDPPGGRPYARAAARRGNGETTMELLFILVIIVTVVFLLTAIGHGIWLATAWLLRGGRERRGKRGYEPTLSDDRAATARCLQRLRQQDLIDEPTLIRVLSAVSDDIDGPAATFTRAPATPSAGAHMAPAVPAIMPLASRLRRTPPTAIPAKRDADAVARAVGSLAETPRFVQPVEPPVEPAREPRRPLSEMVAAFMAEKNIRWGELVGGLLIVGCSAALVISLWAQIEAIPVLKFAIFTAVTTAIFGAGLFVHHRWKIPTTSHVLLIVATLLVPLNMLAFAAFSLHDPAGGSWTVAIEWLALLLFGVLAWLAGRVVVADSARTFAAGVVAVSGCTLAVRYFTPMAGGMLIGAALAPVGLYVATTAVVLRRLMRRRRIGGADARRTFIQLGVQSFACLVPFGLVVYASGQPAGALHRVAPLFSALAGPALVTGLLLWRRLERGVAPQLRTAAASVGLVAIAIMIVGAGLAWPAPAQLLPATIVVGAAFVALSRVARHPVIHACALVAFSAAWVLGVHLLLGNLAWNSGEGALRAALLSARSGQALVVSVAAGAALAAWFHRRGRMVLARGAGATALVLALASVALVTAYGFGRPGDPEHVVWVYALYAAAILVSARQVQLPVVTCAGWLFAQAAISQALVYIWPVGQFPWSTSLLVGATLCVLAAWAPKGRQAPTAGALPRFPLPAALALVFSLMAGAGMLARVQPDLMGAFSIRSAWLAGLWLVLASATRRPFVLAGGQLALAVATAAAVQHQLLRESWFPPAHGIGQEPWFWQAHAVALAGLCLAWQVVRSVLQGRTAHAAGGEPIPGAPPAVPAGVLASARALLHPRVPAADRWLTALSVASVVVLALWSVATGVMVECGETVTPVAAYAHAAGAGSWIVLAVVSLTLLLAHREGASALPLCGLVLMLPAATALVAARYASAHHVVTVLRWLPVVVLFLISLGAWTRGLWSARIPFKRPAASVPAWTGTGPLLFAVLAGPAILLSVMFAIAVGRDVAPLPPGMTEMDLRLWLLGPIVLIAAVLMGHGRSMRNSAFAGVSAAFLCVGLTVVELSILNWAAAGRIVYADIIWLVQLNVIVSAAVALAWSVLARSAPGDGSDLGYPPGLLLFNRFAVGAVLALATLERGFFPGSASPAVVMAGGAWGGAALVAAELALWLRQSRQPTVEERIRRHSVWAMFGAVYLASALAPWDTGNWLCFHALLVGFTAAGLFRLALGELHVRQLRGPGWQESFAVLVGRSADAGAPLAHDLKCTSCGYNLRGLARGVRCPECNAAVEVSITAAVERLATEGAACVAYVRAHVGKAVLIGAALTTLFALRAAFDDPQRPWWSGAVLVVSGGLIMALAAWMPRRVLAYAGGAQMIIAANAAWLVAGWRSLPFPLSGDVSNLMHINVIALAVAGLAWLAVEKRFLLHRVAAVHVPRIPFHHAAALLATAGVVVLSALALGAAVFAEPLRGSAGIAWLALGAAAVLMIASRLDATFFGTPSGVYALALAAVLRLLATVDVPLPTRLALTAPALAAFAVLTTLAWRRWSRGVDASADDSASAHWLPGANGVVVLAATAIAFYVSFVHPAETWRYWVALAPLGGAAAAALLAAYQHRTFWQAVCFAESFLAGTLAAWAWLPPGAPAGLLQRAIGLAAVAALSCAAASAAPRLPYLRSASGAIRRTVAGIGIATAIALTGLCACEIGALAAQRTLPLAGPVIALGILSLALLGACCTAWALRPAWDPLRAQPAVRGAYIYLAEALAGVLTLHIRATMPWLFSGLITQYWPMLVMGIAFAAVAGGEVFARRGLVVLSRPLTRTGIVLPWVTVAELFLDASRVHYSVVLLCAGVLYAALAAWRRSARLAALAVLALNGSLWYLLYHIPGLSLTQHPQLWFIPPALAVLAAGQLNHRRLSAQQLSAMHYGCLLAIYLSSTADMVLIGVARAPWLPFVLAGLSVAGVLTGFLSRIRSFLMLGMGFLCLALLSMIWHAATNLGWTWLWYVAGIALGAAIITVFALFEKKRSEMQRWITELKNWAG